MVSTQLQYEVQKMNAEGKKTPQGVPPIFQELNEQVRQGAAAPEAAENVYVRMLIDGGEHGERYHFHFVASGRGEVESGIRCDLSDREYETQTAELQQEDWAKLLQSLNIPALIESRQLNVHIPP